MNLLPTETPRPWPDAFVWTNSRTGERLILDPAEVEMVWTDRD